MVFSSRSDAKWGEQISGDSNVNSPTSLQEDFLLTRSGFEEDCHSSAGLQVASGLNSLIAVAVSVVVFAKSFWSSTPSWLMMNVITPEFARTN